MGSQILLFLSGYIFYIQLGRVGSPGRRVNCYLVGSDYELICMARFQLWYR